MSEAVNEVGDSVELVPESTRKTNGDSHVGDLEVSRGSPTSSAQPITLDEGEADGESELSQTSTPAKRPSPPAERSSPPSKRVVRTLNTSQAVWSPDRKSKKTQAIAGPGPQTTSSRAKLRQRIAGYASQGAVVPEDASESEDEVAEVQVLQEQDELDDEDGQSSGDEVVSVIPASPQDEPNNESNHTTRNVLPGRGRRISEPVFADEGDDDTVTEAGHDDYPPAIIPSSSREPSTHERSIRARAPLRSSSSGFRSEISSSAISGEVSHTFDLSRLQARYATRRDNNAKASRPTNAFTALRDGSVSSAAGFQNRDAASAEAALNRVISKVDFDRMEVLGQFNKGFIIARLRPQDGDLAGSDDLFIVDQHASDEKFNFETLQRTTVIKAQTLIKSVSDQV